MTVSRQGVTLIPCSNTTQDESRTNMDPYDLLPATSTVLSFYLLSTVGPYLPTPWT